ncbi:hypothetical protein BCR37DRAFT_376632 [Protomyces lactucae-debilis]|uniref:DUF2423 domain-containing protein n=1 Tax=Protomyces lactucae-debilis TaxID=2754530 RepID=A0A1Y2FR94_PROLT|nr:uncharacterized protein BCR37DRAFT_376632 [Protomyces lactucae-debilis]ORY86097.1 hypothetical protein BCR37DRAFT_376632 [Protomyces lactucae-debilis]
MAKSIRSSTKMRFRAVKRKDRSIVEDQRLARLAARLAKRNNLATATNGAGEGDAAMETDGVLADAPKDTAMEVDTKKVSTSGSRGSARETWKGGKFLAKKRSKSVLSDRQRRRK